jgi:hypothetical protein
MQHTPTKEQIRGYTYGETAPSPLSLNDLELLKKTVLFSGEDEQYLRRAGEVLRDQVDAVLDLWYGFVGNNEHLLRYFSKDNQPNSDYLTSVRARFGQWIKDLCTKPFDQDWLNYQHEIALRHHSTKKNKTDDVDAAPIIHHRYLVAFIYPITATIKPFLANKEDDSETVEKMFNAWFKAVTLTATLWTYPYVRSGEF